MSSALRRTACVVGLLALGAPVAPAAADAPWSEPATVGAGGIFAGRPTIGLAADGSGVVAWRPRDDEDDRNPPSLVLALDRRGRPGALHRAPGTLVGPPAVFGRRRVALLRGRDLSRDRLRGGRMRLSVIFATTDRPVGRARELVTFDPTVYPGGDARLVANDRGDVLVGWVESEAGRERLRVAARPSGARPGRPVTLARGELGEVLQFTLAMGARGDAVVAFTAERGARRSRSTVQARVARAGGAFAPARALGPSRGATDLSAAVAPDGRAVVAWGSTDPGETTQEPYDVRAALGEVRRGRFGAAQTLERGRVAGGSDGDVVAALAPDGTASVAFSAVRRGEDPVLVATARPGGRFARPADLGPGSVEDLVVGARGGALAVWTHEGVVRAAVRRAGASSFGAPEQVSPATEDAASADAALDARSRRAAVVWDAVPHEDERDLQAPRHAVRLAWRPLG